MLTLPTPSVALFSGLPSDISVEIVSHMDVDQLVRLKGTCSLADEYVGAVLHTRSRKLLDHGLRSYDGFIARLVQFRAVVGGIAALCILFPYHGRPPFVDVFVPDDTYDDFMEYLLYEEGDDEDDGLPHIPQLSLRPPPRYPPGVSVMYRFSRGDHEKGGFSINLVRSTTSSAVLPITSELHTALFNYVSPRGFCSAYTQFNQARLALLNPLRLDEDYVPPKYLRPALAAWCRNGWDLNLVPLSLPNAGPCRGVASIGCAAATRYFGDRHCAFGRIVPMHLRHMELEPADDSEDTLTVLWWRGGVTCGWPCHSGSRELVPGARVCLRIVADGV
ncbi:hypothetical protein OH76DRAFT_1366977 [Lentinus brumalis]|uniref:F-box domain-containing protein n=1 Tax=Lentinus brumalis TaxID=2498619 RepID=A0A371CI50_9APHY|nr:hypothetical protein OH76DRAFT_1366977 [Polyporus brumalis]